MLPNNSFKPKPRVGSTQALAPLSQGVVMRFNVLIVAISIAAVAPLTFAQSAPDPLFGNDPHAKAVLDCHADYARRFSRALIKPHATPTEVATAAYAHCIGQFN